jgi:hypothetical protein
LCSDPWYEEIYNDKPVVTCKYRRAPLTFREVSAGLNPKYSSDILILLALSSHPPSFAQRGPRKAAE